MCVLIFRQNLFLLFFSEPMSEPFSLATCAISDHHQINIHILDLLASFHFIRSVFLNTSHIALLLRSLHIHSTCVSLAFKNLESQINWLSVLSDDCFFSLSFRVCVDYDKLNANIRLSLSGTRHSAYYILYASGKESRFTQHNIDKFELLCKLLGCSLKSCVRTKVHLMLLRCYYLYIMQLTVKMLDPFENSCVSGIEKCIVTPGCSTLRLFNSATTIATK